MDAVKIPKTVRFCHTISRNMSIITSTNEFILHEIFEGLILSLQFYISSSSFDSHAQVVSAYLKIVLFGKFSTLIKANEITLVACNTYKIW